jgi:hypothetical protein
MKGDATVISPTRAQVATDAGLSERQRVTAVRVAAVPEADFEQQVESPGAVHLARSNPNTIRSATFGVSRKNAYETRKRLPACLPSPGWQPASIRQGQTKPWLAEHFQVGAAASAERGGACCIEGLEPPSWPTPCRCPAQSCAGRNKQADNRSVSAQRHRPPFEQRTAEALARAVIEKRADEAQRLARLVLDRQARMQAQRPDSKG